jgi:hypothetical protein
MFEITQESGQTRLIEIRKFAALDGWDIQQRFIEFATSMDKAFRREFTLEVLSYATVIVGESKLPLTTDALIDNHLQTWENVQKLFEEILIINGIDPKTHADKPMFWSNAGAEMAISFIAEASKLIGPALEMTSKNLSAPQ